jgi:hypothetical protein
MKQYLIEDLNKKPIIEKKYLVINRRYMDLHITGHNSPRKASADWWVLTTANAAETNDLTCLRKHVGARHN